MMDRIVVIDNVPYLDGVQVTFEEVQAFLETDPDAIAYREAQQAKADALAILMQPTTGTTVAALRATVEQQRIAYLTLLGEEPV